MTRVGVVGLGTMGRNHLRALGELYGAELVAVCDQDASQLETATRKYGVPGYRDWNEMFDESDLEAAIVAVPTKFHLEAGRAALERGIHVLVEKPIAASLEEGRALVDAAARANRVLAVGHIERFNPAVLELKRRVAAGDLGRIFQIHASRQGPFPARIRDVGVVVDLATHDLDVMRYVVGSEVSRVYAEAEQRIHTQYEDLLNALLKFANGVVGVLQVNWLTPTKIRQLSVLGETGLFVANYLTQELTYFKNANVELQWETLHNLTGVSEGEMVRLPVAQAEPLPLELRSFLDSISGAPIAVDGASALHVLMLALALVRSAAQGRVIELGEAPVRRRARRGGR